MCKCVPYLIFCVLGVLIGEEETVLKVFFVIKTCHGHCKFVPVTPTERTGWH